MSSQDGHVEGGVGRGRDHGRFVDELRNGVAIDVICIEGEGEIGLKKTQDPDVAQRCLLSGFKLMEKKKERQLVTAMQDSGPKGKLFCSTQENFYRAIRLPAPLESCSASIVSYEVL